MSDPSKIASGVALTVGGLEAKAQFAEDAERLGYESLWVSEVNGTDAVTTICAIAARTQRIALATGIVGIYLRDPLLMAMTVNSLNEYSKGRIVLGFGTSTAVIVEKWHGIRWVNPLGRTAEYIELVRNLLKGERIKHDGLYTLSGAQLGVPPNGVPPVYLGALNQRMLRLAARVADGVILNFPTMTYAKRAVDIIERELALAGRSRSDFNVTAFLRTTVTDRPADLLPRYRSELLTYVLSPVYRKVFSEDGYGENCDRGNEAWATGNREAAAAAVTDDMIHDHAVLGSLAYCQERFVAFRALGIDNPVVFPIADPSLPALDSVTATMQALVPVAIPKQAS